MKEYVNTEIIFSDCKNCPHFSQGFMSEPNECGWYNEPYEHIVSGDNIPDWCPIK